MGLVFHIGQGGIDHLGEFLGEIEMDEHSFLRKNGFLEIMGSKVFTDDLKHLPYFDDVTLTHEQVIELQKSFNKRKKEITNTAGFRSSTLDKMEGILNQVVSEGHGLSTVAD